MDFLTISAITAAFIGWLTDISFLSPALLLYASGALAVSAVKDFKKARRSKNEHQKNSQ